MRRIGDIKRILVRAAFLFVMLAASSCTKVIVDPSHAFTTHTDNARVCHPLAVGSFYNMMGYSDKAKMFSCRYAKGEYFKWGDDEGISNKKYTLFFVGDTVTIPYFVIKKLENYRNVVIAAEKLCCFKDGDTTKYSIARGELFSRSKFIERAKKEDFPMAEVVDEVSKRKYKIPEMFVSSYIDEGMVERVLRNANFRTVNATYQKLATANGKTIALSVKFPKGGKITFISTPFLFTNYVIASDCGKPASLLSNITVYATGAEKIKSNRTQPKFENAKRITLYNYPIYYDDEDIYEAKLDGEKKKGQPMRSSYRVEKEEPSFWETLLDLWPYLLILIPLLVGRRGRAVPVIDWFTNKSAAYIKHLGKLYYKEGNWKLILQKKATYFANDIKERIGIEILDKDLIGQNAELLSQVVGKPAREMKSLLIDLNYINSKEITQDMFVRVSSKMSEILDRIGGKAEIANDNGARQNIKVEIEEIDEAEDIEEIADKERKI